MRLTDPARLTEPGAVRGRGRIEAHRRVEGEGVPGRMLLDVVLEAKQRLDARFLVAGAAALGRVARPRAESVISMFTVRMSPIRAARWSPKKDFAPARHSELAPGRIVHRGRQRHGDALRARHGSPGSRSGSACGPLMAPCSCTAQPESPESRVRPSAAVIVVCVICFSYWRETRFGRCHGDRVDGAFGGAFQHADAPALAASFCASQGVVRSDAAARRRRASPTDPS